MGCAAVADGWEGKKVGLRTEKLVGQVANLSWQGVGSMRPVP